MKKTNRKDQVLRPVETVGSGPSVGHLYLADNLSVLTSGSLPGPIRMIYADPPFEVGSDFYVELSNGRKSGKKVLAYTDRWNSGQTYIDMITPRLEAMHSVLAEDGCFLFHCDWRLNARVRLMLDDMFGRENFLNEIIWAYRSGGASRKESLARKHDYILFYRKSKAFRFRPILERQYLDRPFMESRTDREGRYYVDTLLRDVLEGELTTVQDDDITKFNVRPVLNVSSERLGYPTQKPMGLLKLLIRLTTGEDDIVADFFCGSGTTLHAAHVMGRKWIGCDAGPIAVHTTWKRLLAQRDTSPKRWQLFAPAPSEGKPADIGLRLRRGASAVLRCQLSEDVDYWSVDWSYREAFKNRQYAQREEKSGKLQELSLVAERMRKGKLAIDLVDACGARKRIIL